MEKLDQSVLGALEQQIVAPERLPDLLSAFLERSDQSDIRRREELALLRSAKTNSTGALSMLYELIEPGLAAPSDRDFAERLTHHRQRIAGLTTDIKSLEQQLTSGKRRITPEFVERFGTLLREGLRGDYPALRQAYVRLLVDEVIVGAEKVKVRGSRKALESAAVATSTNIRAGVPISAREWRATQSSANWSLSLYSRERGTFSFFRSILSIQPMPSPRGITSLCPQIAMPTTGFRSDFHGN